MLIELLSAICIVGIAISALLIIVQAISLERAANIVARMLLLPILAFVMLCLVKKVIVPVVITGLIMLQHIVFWFLGLVFALMLGIFAIRRLIFKRNDWVPKRGNRERGES